MTNTLAYNYVMSSNNVFRYKAKFLALMPSKLDLNANGHGWQEHTILLHRGNNKFNNAGTVAITVN
jgi:hypothetical protein